MQMKNCEPLVLAPLLAMATAPSTYWLCTGSSLNWNPGPPSPQVPDGVAGPAGTLPMHSGSPPWMTKADTTRWNGIPS
jgi:hypothetical protein